jgi:DNA transformation protein
MASEYEAFLAELLAPLGGIAMRRMFGGLGIHRDGLMFALVTGDTLYFKVDETTVPRYQAEGSDPFTYRRKDGRTVLVGYWRAPERLFDDPDAFLEFAREAVGIAERAAARKPAVSRKKALS